MIGKRVRVFWPVDDSWYTGTVQQYDPNTGEHLLKYHDGDTEWVKIGENNTNASGGSEELSGPNPATRDGPPDETQRGGGGGDMGERSKWPGADPTGSFPGAAAPHFFAPNPYVPPQGPGSMTPYGGMQGMMPYGMMYPAAAAYGGHMFPPGYGPPPGMKDDRMGSDSYGRRKTGPKAWSKHEDELLLSIVQQMQWPMKWTVVAQSLPDRTGKQCRERYVNHLNPRLKVSDWTLAEDATIFHLYNSYGSHWARMSKVIPGRTDNGIKNRFHNIRRQYEREDEHRMRLSSNEDFPEEIRLDRLRKIPKHLKGNAADLWDMDAAIGVLAAQSVIGNANTGTRNTNRFGPFREAKEGEICVRCGFLLPSLHTGKEICNKTGWCKACTKIPPHASSNFLRECLNLRRCQDKELRGIIEAWEEYIVGDLKNKPVDDDDEEEEKTEEVVKEEGIAVGSEM